jgi:ligand-binding sensor domain-containing protein/serine phosphatase RsbU (regulator of sigma subunit)
MTNWKGTLIILFSLLTSYAFPQSYKFRNFNSNDGLTQTFIYSIIQDTHGYLWIGTGSGLYKYNGFTFENYALSDSSSDNFITCGINAGENLWFGHMNGMISYSNGKKFHSVNSLPSGSSRITHFTKNSDGNIWVSTYSGCLVELNSESVLIKQNTFKDNTPILSFALLNDNELLVGTNSGLLYCRLGESGEIEIIRHINEIAESKITCIQKMRIKSGFYISTENDGIFKLIIEDKLFKVSKINSDPAVEFPGIQEIYEDNQSNLWLASFGKGLIKMMFSPTGEVSKIIYFNTASGFITDNVKTIFEDHEGNVWSGNYGQGLTLITPKTFSVHKFNNQYGNNIFSICLDQQFRWIGTENGMIKMDLLTDKIVRFYGPGSGLPKDTVTTIYSADGKELWIGTGKNGLFRMNVKDNKILKYPIGEEALENSITIITGKGEQVWIGTKKGLCNIDLGSGKESWYTISRGGLPHNYINCLFIDKTGRLWVTTHSNTLAYILDEKVIKIPSNSVGGILTITEDSDLRIWMGSNGNGVYKIDSDSIPNISVKEGLFSNYCYSLICDDHNNIWVGHKGGLSRIRTSDFSVKSMHQIESATDNYQFNPNAIIKDPQGKIWFGSDKGLVSYDPSMEYPNLQPPVLGITLIKINDDEKEISDKIILSPGTYKIRIDFLGISLKEPDLVNYQYKLEGYDQWSEITKNTTITYNHLTEGVYTFILKASSGDGAISEKPLTLSITIKKPIWKKWWFYATNLLLLFILTYIYIKRREYKFLAEKRILEDKVKERTYEIQCQKNEIELQRDEIDEKNARITSSIKYASNIQNAVLPPSELIERLLPDNFILSKPKDIVSGDFYWLAEKDNKIVFTVADCTGHGVPGAFMSLLGITLLNEIVNVQGITRSDAIITKLRQDLIHSLQQSRKDIPTSDGIDIALCVLDHEQKKIQFTGGMNNLIFIRDGKLEVIRGDRSSVCVVYNNIEPFTMKEIEYRKGDVLYLFSDGYPDQFGGEHDRRYFVHRFYVELLDIHRLPMLKQKEILEKNLKEWMRDYDQTDDITVMGIRL